MRHAMKPVSCLLAGLALALSLAACGERAPEPEVKRPAPPISAHSIDGYQVDLRSNRCMLCHARSAAASFQAPPVSVTHYMDRDDQFLAEVSPRRYFCVQCHVTQTDAQPLVANGFMDIDEV